MSNDKPNEAAPANTETPAEVTTMNSHATIEPAQITTMNSHATIGSPKITASTTEATTGTATPDNSHATDEKA
ncbi:hypothetical protein [Streptomyces sp. NPDC002671]